MAVAGIVERAAALVARACSSPCVVNACARLRGALEAVRDAVNPEVVEASYVRSALLAVVASLLEDAEGEAARRGCTEEAAMLREVAVILRSLASP